MSATESATVSATASATESATWSATASATESATWSATASATESATRSAIESAIESATSYDLSRWYVIPGDMRQCAQDIGVGDFGLKCAANAWRMWQGGNQWSYWDSFLTFFQDVAQLPLDYSAYSHWRALSEHSGPRIMHPDFCMISDRPEFLTVDAANRPHGEDGPFCRWRDGSALYSWHGTRIPALWIENRKTIDPKEILQCREVEQRAAGMACIGWARALEVLDYKLIDSDPDPMHGELIEISPKKLGLREPGRFLKAECPRNGTICEGVPRHINSVLEAQAWRVGLTPAEFSYPSVRT